MRSSRVRPSREAGDDAADAVVEGRLGVDGPELILFFADFYVLETFEIKYATKQRTMQYPGISGNVRD